MLTIQRKQFANYQFIIKTTICYLIRPLTGKGRSDILLQNGKVYDSTILDSKKVRLYAWGLQETGALGLEMNKTYMQMPNKQIIHHPTRIKFFANTKIVDAVAGYGFSAFAVEQFNGETIFGTGLNSDAQLGFRLCHKNKELDVIIYPTPIQLPRLEEETVYDMQVKCMAAGRAHLVVVTKNDTIFTMGNNAYGQCGIEIKQCRNFVNTFIHRIDKNEFCELNDEIVDVECGQDHTIFLTKFGHVYTCGWGADGQTGRGCFVTEGKIKQIFGDIADECIVKLSCSADCVLALNTKGEIFGWGNSEYGQLSGNGNTAAQINCPRHLKLAHDKGKIIDIASGGSFCMILNDEGLVYTWGYGILGFGSRVLQSLQPQLVLPALFGRNDFSENTHVISIGCGIFHMGAINSDGDLFVWGKNRFGHLGLGHNRDQFFPFKVAINGKVEKVVYGVDHTLAICKSFL